jgi:hypothetical protein
MPSLNTTLMEVVREASTTKLVTFVGKMFVGLIVGLSSQREQNVDNVGDRHEI